MESRWYAWVVYVLRGESEARLEAGCNVLSHATGSLLVVNAGKGVEVCPSPGALCVVVRIDMRLMRNLLGDREPTFFCDPSLRHQASYNDLERLLEELLKASSEGGDFQELYRRGTELAFVRCLVDGFAGAMPQELTRAEAYCRYLDAHYRERLSLADAARHFHLSTEHFAKVFKAEVKSTFHAQLTDIRLDAALELLTTSDATVTHVALEAGFPNTATLNQAFQARYGTTPTRYRKEQQQTHDAPIPQGIIESLAHDDGEDEASSKDEVLIEAREGGVSHGSHRFWRDSMGLGPVSLLSCADAIRDTPGATSQSTASAWI